MNAQNSNEIPMREVTEEMIDHLPEIYRKIGWQYVEEGKWVLKKQEEAEIH